jgi:hypothetical protein
MNVLDEPRNEGKKTQENRIGIPPKEAEHAESQAWQTWTNECMQKFGSLIVISNCAGCGQPWPHPVIRCDSPVCPDCRKKKEAELLGAQVTQRSHVKKNEGDLG